MGCELPPDEVLAADQRITAWAHELKKAGLGGGMDQLRARAYLDLLLGKDSRPRSGDPQAADPRLGTPGEGSPDGPGRPGGPADGAVPAGFVGRVTLTAPLATVARLADRPGELAGLGPVDPWLTRDLAAAAAANPKTTWCVTVTDDKGHAIGHGCARPEPTSHAKRAGPGPPGFSFTPASRDGPPGGYGSWRLRTPGPGPGLIVAIDPATCTSPVCHACPAAQCDHEHNTPTRQADGPVSATPAPNAATTTASSSTEMDGRPAPRRHLPVDHPSYRIYTTEPTCYV
jgi:hypothetical protein